MQYFRLKKDAAKWKKKVSKEIRKEEEIMKEKQEERSRMLEQVNMTLEICS